MPRWSFYSLLFLAALTPGCVGGVGLLDGAACEADADCEPGLGCVDGACARPCAADSDCLPGESCNTWRQGGGICQAVAAQSPGPGAPDPDKPGGDPIGGSPPAQGLPCEVDEVLAAHCRHCHDTMPTFGAPMPLVTLDDLKAHGVRSMERALDPRRPMPPPPNPPMSTQDKDTLTSWVQAGMPAGQTCDTPPPVRDPSTLVPEAGQEDCEFPLDLRAYGATDPSKGFEVPPETDLYVCFTFRVPWQERVHGLSFRPIVDDARVLHHWLLYSGGEQNNVGRVRGCNGQHSGAALVAGWAPGGNDAVLPPDVGMEMPPGGGLFTLEIHYHNEAGYADAVDRSGVRICATSDLRPNTAAVHWLGTELIFGFAPGLQDAKGTCTPQTNVPLNVISSSPHMHRRGAHMRSIVHRASGGQETLIDKPFDFDNQLIYDTPMIIRPGDTIETTCTFDNPGGFFRFGERTEDEMCYNFVTVWPVGGMESGGSLVGALHSCLR